MRAALCALSIAATLAGCAVNVTRPIESSAAPLRSAETPARHLALRMTGQPGADWESRVWELPRSTVTSTQ